jgi:hypothetical protein
MTWTHPELCDFAVKWLMRPASQSGPGCSTAFSETKGDWNGENPDAIGFRAGVYAECSILMECKTSRADYMADFKKPHRINPATGMGQYRYYMAPEGILKPEELPTGWGLIEVTSRGHIKPRTGHVFLRRDDPDPWKWERNHGAEWTLLARMLARVGDVEALQKRLKTALNDKHRFAKANDTLRRQNEDLGRELYLARFPEETAAPGPRAQVRRVAAAATPTEEQEPI